MLYGYVHLPEPLTMLVDSPLYQRLRRIAQTALTSSVYPSATGSRLEHSLGVMSLAGHGWNAAWRNAAAESREAFRVATRRIDENFSDDPRDFAREVRLVVMGVALLHDLGHAPFSHALEATYKDSPALYGDNPAVVQALKDFDSFHEAAGAMLMKTYMRRYFSRPAFADVVERVYSADPFDSDPFSVLHSLIVGDLDVDRLDYLMRDAQRTGTEFGAVDWERLINALQLRRVGDGFRIAPIIRARSAAETLMIQRTQSYRWIIFHHRVVSTNLALASAFELLLALASTTTLHDVGTKLVSAQAIFQPLLGNLNYVDPSEEDFARVAPAIDVVQGEPQDAAALLHPRIADLKEHLAAAVDDAAVTSALMSARNVAEALRPRVAGPLQEDVEMLIAYVDAAFFRSKNVLTVWRTEDEFAESAERIYEQIYAVADASYELLESRELNVAIERERLRSLFHLSHEEPARMLNWALTNTLAYREQRDRLEERLQRAAPTLRGKPGVWRCAFIPFTAVSRGRKGPALWIGDELKRVSDLSALVRGLHAVEKQLSRVGVFFFLRAPHSVDWTRDDVDDARKLLLGDFLTVFADFFADELPGVLAEPNLQSEEDDDSDTQR